VLTILSQSHPDDAEAAYVTYAAIPCIIASVPVVVWYLSNGVSSDGEAACTGRSGAVSW